MTFGLIDFFKAFSTMEQPTLFYLCFIGVFLILSSTIPIKAEELNEKIILIDPGHGGIDGGAISKNGTVEKDINLT